MTRGEYFAFEMRIIDSEIEEYAHISRNVGIRCCEVLILITVYTRSSALSGTFLIIPRARDETNSKHPTQKLYTKTNFEEKKKYSEKLTSSSYQHFKHRFLFTIRV